MYFIPAYDVESPRMCLEALEAIRAVHEDFGIPGTTFIVGQLLEGESVRGFKDVLGTNLFELGSHTYTHKVLREHPLSEDPVPGSEIRRHEVMDSKSIIEQTFQRPCVGFRPAYGFWNGLRGDTELIGLVSDAGYKYTSSLLWGPDTTLPALLERPFSYRVDGFPDLLEMPAHGYHENTLKWRARKPHYQMLWNTRMRDVPGIPMAVELKTPLEEFCLYRSILDEGVRVGMPYISLIWHPWSLGMFDPDMRMLSMLFAYLKHLGVEVTTFGKEHARLRGPTTVC